MTEDEIGRAAAWQKVMLAAALEAIRVYVPSYDRPHGDDLRILQAGFDLGYEARQTERLVDVGLNHPVSEDLALALRMGQEILERAQRADAEVAALTAQVAALEGELVGLREAVQDAVSAWDDQGQPADDWSHALDEAVSELRALATDPAHGITLTAEEAEEITIILSAYTTLAPLALARERATILRDSLRAKLRPTGSADPC